MRSLLGLALAAFIVPSIFGLLAFPRAEGFGANAIGGRGGSRSVRRPQEINQSSAVLTKSHFSGSFRDAVGQLKRIVVFAVGGVIKISNRIVLSPYVTIAGETAPGGGITIYGNGLLNSNAHHAITRYIRFRMGKGADSGKDDITISDGHDMVFDHISVSWGRDETFSINGGVSNVTISDSIIAQGLETHSCGGLMQTDTGGNWGGGGGYIAGDSDGQSYANIMNNVSISGPSTSVSPFTRGNANFRTYVSRNYYDPNKNGVLDGWELLSQSTDNYPGVDFKSTRYNYSTVKTLLAPLGAYAKIVASVGASKARDNVDTQLINQVKSLGKSGALISDETVSPWSSGGPIAGGTAPTDTDGDGMPDSWESANGLNPKSNGAMPDKNGDRCANIENYINSVVSRGTE
ncbi:pectate lyase [Ceratobasidium sp. AG-Ba]|nr:pectate lyase [Ceratobasidium sp. AG-Ba]